MYWKLKRRILEKKLMTRIGKSAPNLNHDQKTETLIRWYTEDVEDGKSRWEDDKIVSEWLENQNKLDPICQQFKDRLKQMEDESIMSAFRYLSTVPSPLLPAVSIIFPFSHMSAFL